MNSQKIKILTIGGSGLVGSRVNELLSVNNIIDNFSTKSGLDITQPNSLAVIEKDREHQYILLYAAKTDVDACEKDKELGERGEAYKMNVTGVQNVINAAKSSNKKIIYISTDFVFNGLNTPEIGYNEEDKPHPINWYGQTKYLGEEAIRASGLPFLIIRIAYPYRKEFAGKKDFTRALLSRLQNNLTITAVTDHIMNPTFIDDIAGAIEVLITQDKEGVFHVTGSQSLSPYEAVIQIAQEFGLDKSLISPTTREVFFKDRAPRPFNLKMNNDKIRRLGIKLRSFNEGLKFLKS